MMKAKKEKKAKAKEVSLIVDKNEPATVIVSCEQLMQRLLFEWLTKEARSKVRLYVKYYHPEGRIEMYYAMLQYLMTGKKAKFKNGAAQWHFRLFCDLIDEVGYSDKAHQHLKMLWEKIGLLKRMEL